MRRCRATATAGLALLFGASGCGGGGATTRILTPPSATAVQEQAQASREAVELQPRVRRLPQARGLSGIACQPNSTTRGSYVCIGRRGSGQEEALFVTVSSGGALTVAGHSEISQGGPGEGAPAAG